MIDVRDRRRTVVNLVGSPVDEFHAELSRLYAQGCLGTLADADRYDTSIAYVSPGGAWCFPDDLSPAAISAAAPMNRAEALARLAALEIDAVVPQMFCLPGMTAYRSMLDERNIPYVGNRGSVMGAAADKAKTRDIMSAAGVPVPPGLVVRDASPPDLPFPLVVKPVGADNSEGVSLVRTMTEYPRALHDALSLGDSALVETYVEVGREVRCGIVVLGGDLVCLPLEEYAVDAVTKPIRSSDDKLARTDDGELYLVAKNARHAWIVREDDPVTERVWDVARRCHEALGCRHYSLFDFRIDPDGNPWFLEAGPYCSFSPSSVIAVMAAAAGTPVDQLFADLLDELERERVSSSCA